MNELVSLFPVLFFVYVLQCISAVRPTGVVFYLNDRLRGRLLRHWWEVGRSQYRLFFLDPFSPTEGAICVDRLPFTALSDDSGALRGIEFTSCVSSRWTPKRVSFDEPHKFDCRGKQIMVDGNESVSVNSEPAAKRIATLLSKLCGKPSSKRLPILSSEFRNMFSTELLDERLLRYSRSSGYLHVACFSLLLFLFVLSPLMIFLFGLHRVWVSLLVCLVLFAVSILLLFWRSYRELYPGQHEGLWQKMLTIALSPFVAIRANDALLSDLLCAFHPVAVAHRLLHESEFLDFAGAELRRIKYLSADKLVEKFLAEFLIRQSVDIKPLLSSPRPDNSRSRSYCPVCLAQYVVGTGVCSDCNNVSLHPFPTEVSEATRMNRTG